ncbi:hypothetical protein ACQW02_05945 [Humitalea sp. 24SJ18S-53]|uniref:hypothetical protein n=1 Tax=Humitalea sp. 24SJ18S-53 TaxID=3422307 RepID=UPI003D67EDD4
MSDAPVTLLPREVRLVVERILLLTRLPAGSVPAVRDVVLYSAAAGLGGLPLLQRRFDDLRSVNLASIRISETAPGHLAVDAGGQHAWMVLPLLLDALGEAVARHGAALATVEHVLDAEELGAACAMGPRAGLTLFTAAGACIGPANGPDAALMRADAPLILLAAPAADATDAVLARVLRDGLRVEAPLWWELHHLSNTSLSPDTPESRRHAGPVIVEADGRIIGRSDHDDDTDLSLLTEAPAAKATKHEAA